MYLTDLDLPCYWSLGSLGELKWKLDTLRECFLLSLLTMFFSFSS